MQDGIIKGTGNSRYLKSAITSGTTWEQFRDMLLNGTLPIDLNGINQDGWNQIPTWLNKENLLTDDTAEEVWDREQAPTNPTVNQAIKKVAIASNTAEREAPYVVGQDNGLYSIEVDPSAQLLDLYVSGINYFATSNSYIYRFYPGTSSESGSLRVYTRNAVPSLIKTISIDYDSTQVDILDCTDEFVCIGNTNTSYDSPMRVIFWNTGIDFEVYLYGFEHGYLSYHYDEKSHIFTAAATTSYSNVSYYGFFAYQYDTTTGKQVKSISKNVYDSPSVLSVTNENIYYQTTKNYTIKLNRMNIASGTTTELFTFNDIIVAKSSSARVYVSKVFTKDDVLYLYCYQSNTTNRKIVSFNLKTEDVYVVKDLSNESYELSHPVYQSYLFHKADGSGNFYIGCTYSGTNGVIELDSGFNFVSFAPITVSGGVSVGTFFGSKYVNNHFINGYRVVNKMLGRYLVPGFEAQTLSWVSSSGLTDPTTSMYAIPEFATIDSNVDVVSNYTGLGSSSSALYFVRNKEKVGRIVKRFFQEGTR